MTDPLGAALAAVAARSALAYPLVFAAGVVTSIGPCAAPRYVVVAACAHASSRPWLVVAAFTAGLVGAYVVFGLAAGALGALWAASAAIYAVLAAALAVSGVTTLWRADGTCCSDGGVAHRNASVRNTSLGGVLLLGASSALVVSPCCTPVVAAIAGLTAASGRGFNAAMLLAVFACGHAVPVVAAGALGTRLSATMRRLASSQAPSIVAGCLMLALAAWYGALA